MIADFIAQNRPFLVISDFKGERFETYALDELDQHDIEVTMAGETTSHDLTLTKFPQLKTTYKKAFDHVIEQIKEGRTYLLNLTQPTSIKTNASLKTIYDHANAPFKLRYKDEFVCFSPERFIQIEGNSISTYPMKGTIDANVPNAKEKILADQKEYAEHTMVVDLLRNDLGMVGRNVKVEKFRYIDKIKAGEKELLQVSSKITATLPDQWQENFESMIKTLLPAGSISGTPKRSTVEIIEAVEGYERGFFTGVFGIYDQGTFTSAVMIRFIEKSDDGLIYKSGGGITLDSNLDDEYNEMLDKVYIP